MARYDDDAFDAKVELLVADPVAVVSFTFGLPPRRAVSALHEVGSEVWVTVTSAADAVAATERGADVLVAQGLEAGGHRGGLTDDLAGPAPSGRPGAGRPRGARPARSSRPAG